MTNSVATLIFFSLIAVTLFLVVLIGRHTFKTGVEHFSGRLLALSGIVNVFLCVLLLFFQTISNSSLSMSERLFTGSLAVVIPLRVLWNYFTGPKAITSRFNLQPAINEPVAGLIASLSKSMEITPPVILSSDSVRTPFVFGRRSSSSSLAIPEQWNCPEYSINYSVLFHEMAHIRNHDVGFLAWAHAYTQDFKWAMVLFPSLIIFGHTFEYTHITSSLYIYLSCLFVLYGLLKYLLRKREYLADKTAALLIESCHIEQAITVHSAGSFYRPAQSTQQPGPGLTDILYRWLTDKTMFSKYPKGWAVILRVFTFFRVSHPNRAKRIENILSNQDILSGYHVTDVEYFWAGATLGFLGVVIGLCGYWYSGPMNYALDDFECLRLSYTLYGLCAVPTVGLWTVFMTLPFWASLGNPNLNKSFFKVLLKRHCFAFISAFTISLLILTAGPLQIQFSMLWILCVSWYLLIIMMGFCICIVSIFTWNVIRYLQTSDTRSLRKVLWTFIPLLLVALGSAFLGMFWISNDRLFQGACLIFSTVAGLAVFLSIIGRSRFSEQDGYMTVSCAFFTYHMEGEKFLKQYKVFDIMMFPLLQLLLILLFNSVCTLLFRNKLDHLSPRWAIIVLIIISCAILVLIQLAQRGKSTEYAREKIYRLYHCVQLLSISLSAEIIGKAAHIVTPARLKNQRFLNHSANLTTGDIYKANSISGGIRPELSQRAIEWVLRCQQKGGFSLWPQSGPRLVSTWMALSTLKDSDHLNAVHSPEHIFWIKSLQQPDGSFRSPWSKRDVWEDTFFAAQSLNILHASLEPDNSKLCGQWAYGILQDGFLKDSPNKVYHSIGILEALGQIDEYTSEMTSDWLFGKVEKLLLINIGLNYENVHFVIMTYDILSRKTPLVPLTSQIKLLANRIQSALEAELADIRL